MNLEINYQYLIYFGTITVVSFIVLQLFPDVDSEFNGLKKFFKKVWLALFLIGLVTIGYKSVPKSIDMGHEKALEDARGFYDSEFVSPEKVNADTERLNKKNEKEKEDAINKLIEESSIRFQKELDG